ncbi:MAG: hypothetical protein LN415_08940 [Candidatus Thermoplasmatota archaeon]|nr:hypothetical protein [Candidatus Thermoplasmatota archaeon]
MKYIVQMKGDDVVDVILSIKGAVQSYVRYGKFKSASFKANKREGTIAAEGVDKRTLEAALDKAMSNIPGKKLMYEIEEVPPEASPKKSPEAPDAEETYQRWVEQTQRKWDQKKHAYDKEIEKLHEQMRKLREEKRSLVTLRKEDERRHADLQKSYDSVSKVVEGLVEERVPDPLTACAQWVGDWSMTGFKLEAHLREAVGDLPPDEIADLLETSVEEILKEAAKEIDGVESLEDLTSIADVVQWEKTADHKRMHADFERASQEMEFFENVESGAVDVPPTIREGLLTSIGVAENEAVINSYEAAKARYESRTEKADLASTYASRARSVRRLKELRGSVEARSLPVAIVCREQDDKWVCETYYPSSESEGVIDSALEDVVSKAMRKYCSGVPEDETRENVKVSRASVPGKHRSWKDVSRFQEKLHGHVVERLQGSVLGSLGIPVSVSKIMNQRA